MILPNHFKLQQVDKNKEIQVQKYEMINSGGITFQRLSLNSLFIDIIHSGYEYELADFLHNFHSETITTVILSMSPQLISQLDCALILLSLQDFQLINHLIIYCIVN